MISSVVLDAEDELHKMEDVFNQRLKKLDGRDHHTFVAIQWLKENKDMFEKPVHQPVIVMVSYLSFTQWIILLLL